MRKHWMSRALPTAAAAQVSSGLLAQSTEPGRTYVSPWRTPWTYEGERGSDHWAELDSQYSACGGKEQSPIDIRATQKAPLPGLRFDYRSGPIKYVINNGHTIRVNYYAPGSGDFLIVGDKRYQLTQFHFHHPSEEYVHGKRYQMVVHLVHQADDGEVVTVAVFLKTGNANPAIQKIWEHMPRMEGQEEVPGVMVNPADFLPADTAYYTYAGSQTAPPCTEGVKWILLKSPIGASARQISTFAQLYPHDVRPLQPLNGRVVMESQAPK
jgi:carbonic anhydrase